MNFKPKKGFTIIEVLLALAISAALTAAIMATVQVSINRHRYLDSVTSFRDFLRGQYDQLNNVAVTNVDDKNLAEMENCGDSGTGHQRYGTGRSNCLMVGRLIKIEPDGPEQSKVRTKRIFYDEQINTVNSSNDFENFFNQGDNQSNVEKFDIETIKMSDKEEEYFLEWSTKLLTPDNPPQPVNDITATILIVRSPDDGTVRTFTAIGDYFDNTSYLVPLINQGSQAIDFCVRPANNPYGPVRAVRLNANATNSSAIEIMPTDEPINRDGRIVEVVKCSR